MSQMTLVEEILAKHAGCSELVPGQLVNAKVDLAFGNDITAPIAIKEFEKWHGKKVFDRKKVAFVADHFTPAKDIASAEQVALLRRFAKAQDLPHFYEGSAGGVEHALLPELGLIAPGDVVIGADSHTCTHGALGAFATGVGSTDLAACMVTGEVWFRVPDTLLFECSGQLDPFVCGKDLILHIIGRIGVDGALYKAMEFTGETILALPMDDRFTLCNMAIEAGAKAGIIAADAVTEEYLKRRGKRPFEPQHPTPSDLVEQVHAINVSRLRPQVAAPSSPQNVFDVDRLMDKKVDQVVIGSCTNGRLSDLRIAAKILLGKRVHPDVRLIVLPATQSVYAEASREGILDVFLEAGAVVGPPTCGPCLGGHMGVLAKGEVALSTTNRNFVGRMGDLESEVYLASPAVAAATAIKGKIWPPDKI